MPTKLIAFHLPQFHPIPENNAWWGEGFTEWTNVTRAKPLFPGHHQPQLPSDLGFYDLRLPEAREAQAALAREYGIHGFCYYHYWFNGRRLLERPVEEILASGKPDFPFCLCWANENWTRRWDGAEQEVLIGQNYNDDDDRNHIQYLINAFQDPRYIRIDGRPLILIYRARHLPNPKRTTDIWRSEARKAGIGEIYICRVENFFNERDDPHALGFDASVDFQPDWKAMTEEHPSVTLPDGHVVVDYDVLVDAQLARPEVPHQRFPGVTPSWDNSARRKKGAFIIADSSPESYEYWLEETIRRQSDKPDSEQIVFINAWNEWAEGNHLEPDQKFGRGYLEATRRAAEKASQPLGIKAPPLNDPLACDHYVTRSSYGRWLAKRALGKQDAFWHDERLNNAAAPQIHVVVDGTKCSDEDLTRSLRSLSEQLYENWRLDVISTKPAPQVNSSRLAWYTVPPEHAATAIAQLVQRAEAPWHAVLHGGDALIPEALLFVAQSLISDPDYKLIFTDGDQFSEDGAPQHPWLAPGVNPDWIRSSLRIDGLVVGTSDILLAALADIGNAGTGALSLAATLRALDQVPESKVRHLSFIAMHRGGDHASQPLQIRAGLLQAHLTRQNMAADIRHGLLDNTCRVVYSYPAVMPQVAILIPEIANPDDLLHTVESVLSQTPTLPFALLLPLAPSTPNDVRECLLQLANLGSSNLRIVEIGDGSASAAVNQLARATDADLLLILKAGLMPVDTEWLDNLARHALRPEVGAVGARIVTTDGAIHTAFLRVGQMGSVASPHVGVSVNYAGHGGELLLDQNCSAVSRDCMMIRRSTFISQGGFADRRYPDVHADVDFCLRLGTQQLSVVWTPYSTLASPQPAPAPKAAPPKNTDDRLLDDWRKSIPNDPYFNNQFTRYENSPTLEPNPFLSSNPTPWRPAPRILVHPADFRGCGEMRIATPLRTLARHHLIQGGGGARFLTQWELASLAPDTVVFQRPYTDTALAWLSAYRRHSDSFLVYELDDLITRLPAENAGRLDLPHDIEARVEKGMGICDRLVVSTAPLADAYRRYAREVVVMPNLLDNAVWDALQPARYDGPRLRIGWAGSSSHTGDLVMMEEVLRTLSNEVDWIFLGYCPDRLRPFVREFHPPAPIDEYPAALAKMGLDIAIAPLAANAFNEAKSNLKLLEYGALGYPVVCSNVLPYQGDLPAIRVANTSQQWIKALRSLISDSAMRASMGESLRAKVRSEWMIDSRAREWLNAWTRTTQ
ncbi:MAG: glycoside hydrolase family 99-like domain-containing protein [Actinomycetota bacterium]